MARFLSLLWAASPSLPVGGFAFSQGLEMLVEKGEICSEQSLLDFLRFRLQGPLSHWDLPLLGGMYKALCVHDLHSFLELNERLLSSRESLELYEEERLMGATLTKLCQSLGFLPEHEACALAPLTYTAAFAAFVYGAQEKRGGGMGTEQYSAEPTDIKEVLESYAFALVQNQVVCACKLIPLGQSAGQRVIAKLLDDISAAASSACSLLIAEDKAEHLGASQPFLAIISALHEHQYSRMFRS